MRKLFSNYRRWPVVLGSIAVFVAVLAAAFTPAATLAATGPLAASATPALTVSGQTNGALAGRSLALADLDADGKADLIVGAPSDTTNGALAGQVLIFFGRTTPSDIPDRTINGSRGEQFGWSVADAGDVNADGFDDLVVGAPFNDTAGRTDQGAAYVFLGSKNRAWIPSFAYKANFTLLGAASGDRFGYAVAGAGDANLDGFADVAVGASYAGSGRAYVFYGGAAMDATADKTFSGAAAGDRFGSAIAGGANVDGDASPDLVVGAPMSGSGRGSADVILNVRRAAPKIVTLLGAAAGDAFGTAVAMLNFNADGFADVAIGAPLNAAAGIGAGRVYLYFGASTAGKFDDTADRLFDGQAAGDGFGSSVASGDPRTDGVGDLIVGAPFNDTAGADAGSAYVFYGNATADVLADVAVLGAASGDQFGFSAASGGNRTADFDGDGAADFAVGAPLHGPNSRGAAYLYLGFRVIVPANPLVYGYVLDNATSPKRGLANALVTIESETFSQAVRTTANGSYGLATPISVPPDTYWINASMLNYFPEGVVRALAFDTRTNVSFNLTRLPVVHGTIDDGNTSGQPTPNGHGPLQGATVQALNATGAILNSTTTGASGTYFFRLSQKGTVTIRATKTNYFTNQTTFSIREDQNLTVDLTLEQRPILVYHALDGGSTPPGNDLAGVSVTVSIAGATIASGTTNANGLVQFYVNGQGSAYVNGSKAGYLADSTTTTLVQNTTTPLTRTLNRMPTLSGNVRNALTAAPVRGGTVDLFFQSNGTFVGARTTDNQGDYAFGPLPVDTYDVRVTANGYFQATQTVTLDPNEFAVLDFALVPDTIPPTSSATSPAAGTVETAAEFAVDATASDPNGNGILQVDLWYSYNDTAFVHWGSDAASPYAFTFNASQAQGDGRYAFYTLATDYAGNVESAPAGNDTWVLVDAGLPVSSVQPLPAYTTTSSFTVTAVAYDAFGIGAVDLWYSKDGAAYAKYATDATAPYSWTFDTAALGDGVYRFYSLATDASGHAEAAPSGPDASTTVDTQPPALTITAPAADGVVGTSWVNVTWTGSDAGSGVQRFDARLDGGAWVSVGTFTYVNFTGVADGLHTVDVNATDNAGLSTLRSASFRVDTIAPTITITAPANNEYVGGASVTVEWTASDAGSGLAAIDVRLDAGAWLPLAPGATSYILVIGSLTEGSHEVFVRATDLAGHATIASVTILVDATPPSLTITSPANNAIFGTPSVTVTWTASDAGSGLASVEASLDGGAYTAVTGTSHTFAGLSDGTHTLSLRATDNAGLTTTVSVSIRVDTVPPSVAITAPAANALLNTASVAIAWAASDAGSAVASVRISIDSAAAVDVTGQTSYTASGLSEGNHQVVVTAEDQAGNTASAMGAFQVDLTPPSLQITSPAAGATIASRDVTVAWTATDALSTLDRIEVSVDGGAAQNLGTDTETTLTGLADGAHTVVVTAFDRAGNSKAESVTFTVSLEAPGLSPLALGSAIAVILVIITAAVIVVLRRKRVRPPETAGPPPEEAAKPPEGEPPKP